MPVYSEYGPYPGGVFFSGAATAPSEVVPAAYPVAIAGHPYNIEPKLYRMSHVPIQREATTDEAEPGESTLSPLGLWRRSQSDWSLGTGQTWLDEEESTRRRFRESLGVDVLKDREASLLPSTEEKRTSANSNLRLCVAAGRLYVVDGATLIFSDATSSEQNATWVTGWTTATGLPGGNILGITYSGSHVYVLGNDASIYRATPGTTAFTLFYNPTAAITNIWHGVGRLFAAAGASLYEITATPGETLIFTHPDPNYTIQHVCAAPTGVYIAGNVGTDYGEIRNTWVNEQGTGFVAPVVVAELDNEQVYVTRTIGNHMLIGTSVGFRYAPLDSLTTGLAFGPAVEIGAVRDITIESSINPLGKLDTFAWATWTNIHGGSNSGLVKIRLTRFTEPGVPAYASDVYSAGGGTVLTVATIRGRRYFGVSVDGFFGATNVRVASGYIKTGRIRYGVLDRKVFSDVKWRTAPLVGKVYMQVTFDDGSVTAQAVQGTVGSVSNDTTHIGPVSAEWGEITFTLERSAVDTTTGPTLRWWVIRAIPAAETTVQFMVPLRLNEKERTPLGSVKGVPFLQELEFLAALVDSKEIVKYQEGLRAWSVYVNNIEMAPRQWNVGSHGLEGICMVELHSVGV